MDGGENDAGDGAPANGSDALAGGPPVNEVQALAPAEAGGPTAPLSATAPAETDHDPVGGCSDGDTSALPSTPLERLGSVCGERGPSLSAAFAAAPTGLCPSSAAEIMSISPDGRVVTYNGLGMTDVDAGSALAEAFIPMAVPGRYYAYYWEARIVDAGTSGFIGVGLAPRDVHLGRLVGWEPGTWGYHGDDGNFFSGCGIGESYGPTFSTGDTVGCLWEEPSGKLSFTKNGQHLGVAAMGVAAAGVLYPAIGMRSVGEVVEMKSWGTTKSWEGDAEGESDEGEGREKGRFMFDLDAYVADLAL